MAETITALSEQLFDALQKESFALLSTIDHETGAPAMNAISCFMPRMRRPFVLPWTSVRVSEPT